MKKIIIINILLLTHLHFIKSASTTIITQEKIDNLLSNRDARNAAKKKAAGKKVEKKINQYFAKKRKRKENGTKIF